MAIAAATQFNIMTTGSDTNGGGYSTGGTDYSKQAAKNTAGSNISTTDAVAAGTTTITSITAAFTAGITGNAIYLQGGTGSLAAGWYTATFVSSTSITVDRTVATGTGITMNIGGALLTPGQAQAIAVAQNKMHLQTGTYPITSASTNVSGGCVLVTVQTSWEGYQTTYGDLGTPPLLQASGISTAVLFSTTGGSGEVYNINADGANLTSIQGFNGNNANGANFYLMNAKNCTNTGINSPRSMVVRCTATTCSTAGSGISCASAFYCEAYTNTVTGITLSGSSAQGGVLSHCLSYNNSGASSDGINVNMASGIALSCVAYNNGREGFRLTGAGTGAINCIAEANVHGFNYVGSYTFTLNCATFNNSVSSTSGVPGGASSTPTALSGSPFTAAGSANFTLNATSGAGASCRSAGIPGTYPVATSTIGYDDIGAARHQDPAGATSYGGFFG